MVPLLLHVFQFILLCLASQVYYDFCPQRTQYDIIAQYITGSVDDDGILMTRIRMMKQFYLRPLYCVFAFLEAATFICVMMELIHSPVFCGPGIRTSHLYYPIAMTILDIGKLNVYMCIKHLQRKEYGNAFASLFSLEIFFTYFIIAFVLAGVFMGGVVRLLYRCVYPVIPLPTRYSTTAVPDNYIAEAQNPLGKRVSGQFDGIVSVDYSDRASTRNSLLDKIYRWSVHRSVDEDRHSSTTGVL